MYLSRYVFYKIEYDAEHQPNIHSVHVQTFSTPQEENSVVRVRRRAGYQTLRVNDNIYKIIEATLRVSAS
jgi:hypothetical protein